MSGYPLHQCGLYAVRSKARLARVLGRSSRFLVARAHRPELYKTWREEKASGGYREIEAPREDLKAIQRRIADLLQRVLAPSYLFSPVKGRSYIDNALEHRESTEIRLLDVVNYFGNCTDRAVYDFFKSDLKCAPDIAWILTGLSTRGGHLPQGSPCSPILSFYSCQKMWGEIASLCRKQGCKITVYVDDLTISGPMVPENLIWHVKKELHSQGHRHHPRKERRHYNRPAEVTGIIVKQANAQVPHRHYKKLQDARLEARISVDDDARSKAVARAASLEAQIQYLKRRS
jgi:retron-type reverse transcriptase